ncbi:MAG: hypothetical protein IKQ08_00270 [Paludibacteraceae bacterium]|nr:hypothetical protein [Paludibacteraceae bacterium]
MVTIADFKKVVDGLLKPVTTKIGNVDARIKALLPSDSDEIFLYRDFQRLGKGLQREQLLDGVDNQRYIDVVEIIHNHLGWNQSAIKTFSDTCWQDVIAACSEEMPLPQTDWLKEYDKEHRRAAAAKTLRKFGLKIKIEDCDYVTDNDDIVYDALINWIREAGGRRFLNMLLSQMEYLEPEGRFLTDMNGNMPNPKDVTIVKPYNYLVNLALANINADGGSNSEAAKAFGNAIKLATNYCFLKYPVQNFGNVWEDLFHRDRDTVEFFRDLVYKESIFGLTQHSVWFTRMFCERVLMYMRDTGRVLENGYTFDEYERLMNYVLSVANALKCVELRKDKLNELGIGAVEQLINDVATGGDILNNGFRTPLDEEKENAANKPLIKANGKIYALPVTIGSWGWFEALMMVVRNQEKEDNQKDIDKEVGKLIEIFINEKLAEKGITHCSGTYLPPEEGEADLVVEATKGIMLFEMKKKSLTRKAKSGDKFRIVADLLGSLIDSQAQCFRTSHLIIENGYVDLDDGNGNVTRVEKKRRTAECISVCLGAFGPLQDRMLIKNIMNEICNKQLTAKYDGDDKQTTKVVKKFNKDMQKWIPFLKKEIENGDSKKNPFINSWFLDLEQLMSIINEANSNDEFLDKLIETKFVSVGSYDFYRERKIARMMK